MRKLYVQILTTSEVVSVMAKTVNQKREASEARGLFEDLLHFDYN